MSGPLAGIRGVVLTQAWAGSYCTELLAMAGADIIQLEVRKRPDSWRGTYSAPMASAVGAVETAEHAWNVNGLFNSVNLGKRSFTVDLSQPEGLEIYRALVPYADIVAENFSPRVLGNLGLGYEELKAIKPDVIVASLSAYGHDGPWANIPGIGGTIEPTSGMSALLGYADGQPLNSGQMYPDAVAGLYGFSAIMTALHHRDRTGEGQYIDLSMQEANLAHVGDAALEYSMTGEQRGRLGNRHMTFAPHGIFPSLAGADGRARWVAIAAEDEAQWGALCAAAGRGWDLDERFVDNAGRKGHEDELEAAIAEWTASEERDGLAARLGEAGVIAAPVLDSLEVAEDPVLRERGVIVELEHSEAGVWPQVGAPFHFSATPVAVERAAPAQGQHSFEVFSEFLGMSRERYEELVAKNVSGEGPPE
ncbi:MAG: CoA transferase [Dehalococcoidia bacterium]|nr:CoA transferase [Dehalococcoidia bacterium]